MAKVIQEMITKPCHPRFLNEVRTLLDGTLAEANLSRRDKDLLILAVDEAASAVVQYSRFKGFEHDVSLSIDINDVRFKAVLIDSVNVFELASGMSDKKFAEQMASERRFTMGFFLIRQIMDEINYVYRKGFQNDIEMIKFL